MSVSIEQAANHLVSISGGKLTVPVLSRVVYLAHVRYMGTTEGSLLVEERFFATSTGPGVPQFQEFLLRIGKAPVTKAFHARNGGMLPAIRQAIEQAWSDFGALPVDELIRLTQQSGTAWRKAYQQGRVLPMPDRHVFEEFIEFHDR